MTRILEAAADISMLPQADLAGEWKPFWEGTARGELLIQRCPACQAHQFYPRALCMACGAEPELVKASGRGTLYTYSIIRQNLVPPFSEMVPYALAMVDLAEGVRMMSNVFGCAIEDLRIGMPLRVEMKQAAEGYWIPYWRVDPAGG